MDIGNLTLFGMVKKRMAWLTQRQEVLAQNIANSDTPKYKPNDLRKYNFGELVRQETMQLNMDSSGQGHLPGIRKRIRDFASQQERHPFETAPNGNAVILEEQMGKISETQIAHNFTVQIYKKHLNMIKTALGK